MRLLVIVAALLSCACASRQVQTAAKATAVQVVALSADLSTYSEAVTRWAESQRGRIEGLNLATTLRLAEAERYRAILRVANARTDAEVERLLTDFGATFDTARGKRLSLPVTPMPELPIQALSAIAKALGDITEPGERKSLLEFLVDYARRVNDQLKAADEKPSPE